jgi:hypothetical protein
MTLKSRAVQRRCTGARRVLRETYELAEIESLEDLTVCGADITTGTQYVHRELAVDPVPDFAYPESSVDRELVEAAVGVNDLDRQIGACDVWPIF